MTNDERYCRMKKEGEMSEMKGILMRRKVRGDMKAAKRAAIDEPVDAPPAASSPSWMPALPEPEVARSLERIVCVLVNVLDRVLRVTDMLGTLVPDRDDVPDTLPN